MIINWIKLNQNGTKLNQNISNGTNQNKSTQIEPNEIKLYWIKLN